MSACHVVARRRPAILIPVAAMLGGLCAAAAPAEATSWFVDGRNGQRGGNGTPAAPFVFFWQAAQVVQPGDTVYVLPTMVYPQITISVSGAPGRPITLVGAGSGAQRTKVSGGTTSSAIWINADYVTVKNFDATTKGPDPAILVPPNHHHVTIANNVAHDAGGNGISTFGDDYITISHNVVYGNAKNTSLAFNSGISLLGSLDIDGNTGVKMIVDGNTIYGNTNTPNCTTQTCLDTWENSDGSGVIVDDSRRVRFDNIVYRGRTLICNNVIYGNGGRGVHVYKSDHVTIANNTMFFNNQDPYESMWHPGEVSTVLAGDVQVTNNILYSDGLVGPSSGTAPNTHVAVSFHSAVNGTGPLVAKYNLMFNPQNAPANQSYVDPGNTTAADISQNVWAGAKFERTSLTGTLADYRVRPISPALRRGDAATSVSVDILGRPRVLPPTIGAYQNAGP